MTSPLIMMPMILFFMAWLAFLSGIGILRALRTHRAGWLTSFVWSIFSASICIGFMTFAIFIYITQGDELLPIGITLAGIVAILSAGKLAML